MFPQPPVDRRAGVIMHPTSLPGSYGIGDLGAEAYAFVDWLAEAKMQIWQVLPLVPPGRPIPGIREDYWSPYSGRDAHCGNTLMISLPDLVKDGLLESSELPHPYNMRGDVDFNAVAEKNEPVIAKAANNLLALPDSHELKSAYLAWRARPEIETWLKEAALFDAICKTPELLGKDWWDWPAELRTRDAAALEAKRASSTASIDEFCATQFLFDKQWLAIKTYANAKGVALVGDMPIYVGGHSADVWANQSLFLLNGDCKPSAVAGVPPDAFSEDGQLWGNPLYDWPAHEAEGYRWWAGRLGRARGLPPSIPAAAHHHDRTRLARLLTHQAHLAPHLACGAVASPAGAVQRDVSGAREGPSARARDQSASPPPPMQRDQSCLATRLSTAARGTSRTAGVKAVLAAAGRRRSSQVRRGRLDAALTLTLIQTLIQRPSGYQTPNPCPQFALASPTDRSQRTTVFFRRPDLRWLTPCELLPRLARYHAHWLLVFLLGAKHRCDWQVPKCLGS